MIKQALFIALIALTLSADATTCLDGQFFDKASQTCVACSSDANSDGTVKNGICVCNTNYFWKFEEAKCVQCLDSGCPPPPPPKPEDLSSKCTTAGQYFNIVSQTCVACSSDANSDGTVKNGICVCNTNYFWKFEEAKCVQCLDSGCPSAPSDNQNGQAPPQNGQAPPQNGQAPPQNGQAPPQNGQNGQAPPQNGQAPAQNGQNSQPPKNNLRK